MPDGPSSPDQPKSRLFGFLKRGGNQETPQQPIPQPESKPEKKHEVVMRELEKKNQDLGGYLLKEFGEGESRFLVINHPLRIEEKKYPTDNYENNNIVDDDYLIATTKGFKIFRVRYASLEYDPEFPQYEVVHKRNDATNFAGSVARALFWRGDPDKRWSDPEEKAGSGYSHNGTKYSLNFGQDNVLNFNVLGERGYLQELNSTIKKFAEAQNSVTRLQGHTGRLVSDMQTHSLISLVVEPNPEEVAEIMRNSLKRAQEQHTEKQQRLREEEEQKATKAAEPVPQPPLEPSAEMELRQTQAAANVLKILEED